ncbi:hypothetical protein [Kluyvera genomosp. 2]|uniref:hypothetical protein n=1 Tax=Kluyvera genomosp. 2 TaxID=2774054 RepID=UPI002FD81EC2
MTRARIISRLYQIINSTVTRTLNKQQSFAQTLTLAGDPYISGKFALALSLLLEQSPERCAEWESLWPELVSAPCDNWGKYYFLQALLRLQQQRVLEQVLTAGQLAVLRGKLDWQEMVEETTWQLKSCFPTNFYGVAFSVARLRFLLGWESERASQEILQRLLEHYRAHAENGCCDETRGHGRFDRYSVLLVAEICQRHLETGLPVADWLQASLRQAATLVLSMCTDNGSGFQWGRSIGAYGDSAFNEILAVSARLGLLNAQELAAAGAFSLACSERFLSFWYDPDEQSVNLWFKGRQTDAYRAEHRLVGENISLCVQHLNVQQVWSARAAASASVPRPAQLALTFTAFREARYARGLYQWYDGQRAFVLPLINGARPYHGTSPYFPIPFSEGLFTGVAQGDAPLWVPGIYDERGRVLRPLVWFRGTRQQKTAGGWEIIIEYDGLDVVAKAGEVVQEPLRDAEFGCRTRFLIAPGSVTREDTFTCPPGRSLRIELIAAVYAESTPVRLQGYTQIQRRATTLRSPTGPLAQEIVGSLACAERTEFTVSWQVQYNE